MGPSAHDAAAVFPEDFVGSLVAGVGELDESADAVDDPDVSEDPLPPVSEATAFLSDFFLDDRLSVL